MRSVLKPVLVLAVLIVVIATGFAAGRKTELTISCSPENDVFVALKQGGERPARFDSPAEAVHNARDNSAVLILADGYPTNTTQVDVATLDLAAQKNLRIYIEFPTALPGVAIGPPRATTWERGLVSSDAFGKALPKMRLLAIHDCHFVPAAASNPLLVVARVAGYDTAVFGLPKESFPILFEIPERRMMVATTKLSAFLTARYAPTEDWRQVWELILRKLDPEGAHRFVVEPAMKTRFTATEKLPRGFERRAFERAADWVLSSRLLVPPSRKAVINRVLVTNGETAALPAAELLAGDGSLGILEGYASGIQHDGTQLQRLPLRADCQAESAMVLALDASLDRRVQSRNVAWNLLDFTFFNSGMCRGVRADPTHPAFGLIGWGDISPAWLKANYGDDNARTMLATILVGVCLKTNRWDEPVGKALLANFRTTGKQGFRTDRIDIENLEANGWKFYRDHAPLNFSPHFESGLWACNLWAFRQTGFRPLFDKTTNAIAFTMKAYPAQWRWQDNIQRARMLLCLAWLVRLDDTPEHRAWLKLVATDLIKQQQPNGALHEQFNTDDGGHYRIPQSNEAYGTTETPLIQQNGDPVSDQLYVGGFALFGLHEAVAATGDAELKRAEDKLAEFLCRIQIRSEKYPWLDGWWFRAFDDRRWESWASSADIGWGAWSIEAGWAQAWGVATLALRQRQTSFWDFTADSEVAKPFEKWRAAMLEE
jgi:hypothetical protein